MMTTTHAGSFATASPPASPREPVGLPALFFGLCAGPLVWAFQLLSNFALASYSCYPHAIPRTTLVPGWGWVWAVLLTINLVALAVTLAATAVSWRNWSGARRDGSDYSGHVLETRRGRTRFLAAIGIMTGIGFSGAIVFNTIALIIMPSCAG